MSLRPRLEISFFRHERSAYRKHLEEAASRFDLSKLAMAIERANALVAEEVGTAFASRLTEASNSERLSQSALESAQKENELLHRNFKNELAPLYEELERLKAELSEAYEEKSDAHMRLSSAKSSLAAWYDKSDRHIFGNRGQKLPQRAFFSQDLSDRDYYKGKRDSAGRDIGNAIAEIDSLKWEKSQIGEKIGSIKRDRDQMFALKNAGLSRKTALERVDTAKRSIIEQAAARKRIENSRDLFREDCQRKHNLPHLKSELDRIKAERKEFELKFSQTDERAKRRRRFEEEFQSNLRS